MEERPLFELLRETLLATFADILPALPAIAVKRSYQPGTSGTDTGPTVYLYFMPATRYGWVGRSAYPNPDEPGMIRRELQKYEQTLQATAIWRQGADVTVGPTVLDLANWTAAALQSDAFMSRMRAASVGILRVADVRVLHFENDQDEFEVAPNFDFTLTHEQVTLTKVAEITATEYRQYMV